MQQQPGAEGIFFIKFFLMLIPKKFCFKGKGPDQFKTPF